MLTQAIANARLAGVAHQTDFRTADVAALPFPDASLDLVVSTLSLHHWDDPGSIFDEIARVLRPGGAFLLFDLRRDLGPAPWLLLWFVTHVVVPHRPCATSVSRWAAATPPTRPNEAAEPAADRPRLTGMARESAACSGSASKATRCSTGRIAPM